jgi:hypothetical protein
MQDELDPVLSACPNCRQERVQCYERGEVVEQLRTGASIKAYCEQCGEEWDLSTEERAELSSQMTAQRPSRP